MQGTRVRALVWEDPTCRGATKPMRQSYLSLRSRAREPQLLKPVHVEPVLLNKRKPLQWEARTLQRRVAPARRD